MKNRLLFLLFYTLLNGCSSQLPSPISRFEVQTPRPFGYVIGDQIHHRIVVESRRDVVLNLDSLPNRGELNRWLNLNAVEIEAERGSGVTVIDLTYQVFYAPNEVKMLSIPGFNLQFTQAGNNVEQVVPSWHFTLSPLQELAVRKDEDSLYYMRPDALPAPLSDRKQWQRFYAGSLAALAIATYLSFLYGYFPTWPKRRIFKRALSQLKELSDNELERSLAVIHHAFNTLNARPLFNHTLSAFYREHPEYRSAASQIDAFFDFSNQVLFAGKQDFGGADRAELLDLCRLCRDIECGRR